MTSEVLIIGGGIAGPVTALALHRAGLAPQLFEAHGASADGVGSFLTLADNGLAALDELGLGAAVRDHGVPSRSMALVSARRQFRSLGRFPMRAHTLMRSDLYRVLREEVVRRGIPVHIGKRLSSAEEDANGVRACFADGSERTGDLLVGADGLRSRVRSVISVDAPEPRRVGLLNTAGVTRGVPVEGAPGENWFVFGRRCFFGYVPQPDGEVWWFANPPARDEPTHGELGAIDDDAWRARLLDLFRDDPGPMRDLVAGAEVVLPPWDTLDLGRVGRWRTRRMVLVGDAVHATSPSSGQGASMAIEDGLELARCLRDLPGAEGAFAAYEDLRRDRVERVVALGRRNGSGKAQGPVGAWLRDLVLPVFLRRGDRGTWVTDHRIDFSRPVT
jgi:FAD-dependent urate hydroxylase